MKIAFGLSQFGVVLDVQDISFKDLAEKCSKVVAGGKHEHYFLRGGDMEITPGDPTSAKPHLQSDHYHRNNRSLRTAFLVVVDGDGSVDDETTAPAPELAHKTLKKLKLKHFIYTTHSHEADHVRWRAVLPCFIDYGDLDLNRKSSDATAFKIVELLQDNGCPVAHATEAKVWSQPWYLPTRDDPNDGLFEFYSYFGGINFSPVDPASIVALPGNLSGSETGQVSESLDDLFDDLRSGRHFYTALRKLAYMYVHDGLTRPFILNTVQTLAQTSPLRETDPERFQGNYRQIETLIDDEINKQNLERIDETIIPDEVIRAEKLEDEVMLPDNLVITQLTNDLLNTWWVPNLMIARLTAFSLVAYCAGGKYKSSLGDRLNIQQIAIGDSGTGKDLLLRGFQDVIAQVWDDDPDQLQNVSKGILQDVGSAEGVDTRLRNLGHKHDLIVLRDEIGGLLRDANNNEQKRKFFDYLLAMYTLSNGTYAERALVKQNDGAEILYAPHLNLSGATTPELITKGLDYSFISHGSASRMMFFNCDAYTLPRLKQIDDLRVDADIVRSFKFMYDQESIAGGLNSLPSARLYNPKMVDMSEVADFCHEVSIADDKRDGFAKVLWNRRVPNAKKYAMMCAILEDPINPKVSLSMMRNEIQFVGNACQYSESLFESQVGEGVDDISKKAIINVMKKAGNGSVLLRSINELTPMKKLKSNERKALVNQLLEEGILIKDEMKNARGKPTVTFQKGPALK